MERPCSIVVDVKEIYGSESKSQVYAHLHNLFENLSMGATSKFFFTYNLNSHYIYYKTVIDILVAQKTWLGFYNSIYKWVILQVVCKIMLFAA